MQGRPLNSFVNGNLSQPLIYILTKKSKILGNFFQIILKYLEVDYIQIILYSQE